MNGHSVREARPGRTALCHFGLPAWRCRLVDVVDLALALLPGVALVVGGAVMLVGGLPR